MYRFIKRSIVLPFFGAVLGIGLIVLLTAANFYTFHRLTDEAPIAELTFAKAGPGQYQASISYGDFCTTEHYLLYGDQWRLDARFLKFHPWANLLGLDAMYRIERLGGRYRDVANENTRQQHAYTLYSVPAIDLAALLQDYHGFLSPVDTLFGSSVYEDMDENYRYRVYRSQSALLVRKEKRTADNIITIEINSNCSARNGVFTKLAGRPGR